MADRAVLFDLSGTLVDFSPKANETALGAMAAVLGAPAAEFAESWSELFPRQAVDANRVIGDDLSFVLNKLGLPSLPEQIRVAHNILLQFESSLLTPRNGCIEALEVLKAAGLKLGLVANQSAPVAWAWDRSVLAPLFDDALFSCHAGILKPDPRIYSLACSNLGVTAAECTFVGDGGSRELTGATGAGMRAIQMRFAEEAPEDAFASTREPWNGEFVTSFESLMRLILGDSRTGFVPDTA